MGRFSLKKKMVMNFVRKKRHTILCRKKSDIFQHVSETREMMKYCKLGREKHPGEVFFEKKKWS